MFLISNNRSEGQAVGMKGRRRLLQLWQSMWGAWRGLGRVGESCCGHSLRAFKLGNCFRPVVLVLCVCATVDMMKSVSMCAQGS